MLAALVMVAVPVQDPPQPPEAGIGRARARERAARLSDLRAHLRFDLHPAMEEVSGSAELRFRLQDAQRPLAVDFAGSALEQAELNGQGLAPERVHDHWILPAAALQEGENALRARFRSPVAESGTPLTRYRDARNGEEIYYTLVVPADAHRLFPCFDQPDLKLQVFLELTIPADWQAVANGAALGSPTPLDGERLLWRFAATPPISSYLVAFAAGPLRVHEAAPAPDAAPPLRLYYRAGEEPRVEKDALLAMHRAALRSLERAFAIPYPFAKLDCVLLPGFPYGGMEHPGAIFYRETALSFDHPPTEVELVRRSTLIYHEVAHQWFGNLVTMEWFDDLWLKEGFATFMGYKLLEELEPAKNAWLRFHQQVKPPAYRVDGTAGTVPVYQELANLDDAKSNYGPIVYNKAPAVLRELEQRLGSAAFFRGVGAWLSEHAWGNARWDQLVASLAKAAEQDLASWSERWILAPGLPLVRAQWSVDEAGRIASFELSQRSSLEDGGTWPLHVLVHLGGRRLKPLRVPVAFDRASVAVEELVGKAAPDWVILNADDAAYGRFLLDPASREALLRRERGTRFNDVLLSAVAFSALHETLREGEVDPGRFAELALAVLAEERDALTHDRVLGTLETCVRRYLDRERGAELSGRLAALLRAQISDPEFAAVQLPAFRALARLDAGEESLKLCRALASGEEVAGLKLGPQDRFLAAAALLAADPELDQDELLDGIEAGGDDVAKYRFLARAAAPSAERKAEYFAAYLQPGDPPEQWVQDSLAYFHWPGQEELTLPYLRRALDQLEWVKANRKIFFLPAWIDGFVNAHSSRAALDVVEDFRAASDLPLDVQRKLLQSLDELQRAVRIQERWGR